MADHYVDIYDENYKKVGIALKSEAHKKGLWHRVFTCIIVDSTKKTIYFQKKQPHQYCFERLDYIDIAVGGHYIAGENIEDGIREFLEETGLNIKFIDLISLGIRRTAFSIEEVYKCKEYQHIFLYDLKGKELSFQGDEKEIAAFVEVEIDKFVEMIFGTVEKISALQIWRGKKEKKELSIKEIDPAFLEIDCFIKRIAVVVLRYMRGDEKRFLFL